MRLFENNGNSQDEERKVIQSNLYKEEILNKAFHFHSKGNIPEASKYYELFINKGFTDERVFSNLGYSCRRS